MERQFVTIDHESPPEGMNLAYGYTMALGGGSLRILKHVLEMLWNHHRQSLLRVQLDLFHYWREGGHIVNDAKLV